MKKRSFTTYTMDDLRRYKWWLSTIERAFDEIEEYLKGKDLWFKITYIKEKYGWFRCEYYSFDDTIMNIVEKLEDDTHSICQECWCKWEERNWGRIKTLCDYCFTHKK